MWAILTQSGGGGKADDAAPLTFRVMYTIEQRVFIVREYWRSNSYKQCQQAFRREFGDSNSIPSKSCIHKLVKKLETTGSVLDQHAGGRKMSEQTVANVRERLLASPNKSLRKVSQESGIPYSTCQRVAKRTKNTLKTDSKKKNSD